MESNNIKLPKVIRDWFQVSEDKQILLHEPYFNQDEENELINCIESTYVSSVGPNVELTATMLSTYCDVTFAVPVYSGTAALHLSLIAGNIAEGDIVLTQSFTFIATINSILYCKATPLFIDIDWKNLCLSPEKLQEFLETECIITEEGTKHITTNKIIKACIPMYSFGIPGDAFLIRDLCHKYNIKLIEDAAESLGSKIGTQHLGTIGDMGVLSFNGNKIITSGSGGMVLTKDEETAKKIKHLSNQAKLPDPVEYYHDQLGYNYRLPNLNASLLVAQLKKLPFLISEKQKLHKYYLETLKAIKFPGYVLTAKEGTISNYWLNTVIFENERERAHNIKTCIDANIMVRPPWQPAHTFKYVKEKSLIFQELSNTMQLSKVALNLPSSVKR